MLAFYITCLIFIVVVLGSILRFGGRDEHLRADALPGQGVPADRLHVVLGSRAAPAGGQDGAPGISRPVVGITVPTGYSFNLDGTAIYLTMASLFIAEAMGTPLTIGEQISLLLFMMIASKGRPA